MSLTTMLSFMRRGSESKTVVTPESSMTRTERVFSPHYGTQTALAKMSGMSSSVITTLSAPPCCTSYLSPPLARSAQGRPNVPVGGVVCVMPKDVKLHMYVACDQGSTWKRVAPAASGGSWSCWLTRERPREGVRGRDGARGRSARRSRRSVCGRAGRAGRAGRRAARAARAGRRAVHAGRWRRAGRTSRAGRAGRRCHVHVHVVLSRFCLVFVWTPGPSDAVPMPVCPGCP